MNQQYDNNVLDLVKQKLFYHYEFMRAFKKFKEQLTCKQKLYSSLTHRKISVKEY